MSRNNGAYLQKPFAQVSTSRTYLSLLALYAIILYHNSVREGIINYCY